MTRLSWTLWPLALAVTASPARAELECRQPLFAAGEVRSGIALKHAFELVNRGGEEIEVVEVRPGCGCLSARPDRRRFRAGEAGSVEVEVNTVTQPEGPNTWRTRLVYRQGGQRRELALLVTAQVIREVSLAPANLVVYTDSAIAHSFTLTERRDRPLDIKAVLTADAHIRARAEAPKRNAEGHWERTIRLEVSADCPEGRHESALHVLTGDPLYGELKAPFTVIKRARQGITAVPGSIHLTGTGADPLPARIVLLGGTDGQEVVVERVEPSSPAICCRWAPGPGARVTLKIEVERARLSGPTWEGQVRVYFRKPAGQTVTVPVECTLR
jgi:hypothetical protein